MRMVSCGVACLALALGLAGCTASNGSAGSTQAASGSSSQEATAVQYTYEGIDDWNSPIPTADGKITLHDVIDPMAKDGTDMDAFVHSELGEFVVSSGYLNNHVGDLSSPEVTSYWAERGMVHEAHDANDQDRQWASLVPDDYDPNKSYPLLFVWHGTGNPVLLAEGYGFGEAAAEKDWIVVFPWASNDDLYLSEFDRIYAYMCENYNIDTTKVYTTGFSKGGLMSQLLALQRSHVIAAAAPCGMPAGGAPTEQLRSDDFTHAQAGIPMMFFGGELDGVTGPVPYDTDYKIRGVNGFLTLNGISDMGQTLETSEELVKSGNDPVERAIGLTFDKTESIDRDGTTYRIGSYLNDDGKASVQFVECDGAIHWPTPSMANLALDFLDQWTTNDAMPMEEVDIQTFLRGFSK